MDITIFYNNVSGAVINSELIIDYTIFGEELEDGEEMLDCFIQHFPYDDSLLIRNIQSLELLENHVKIIGISGNSIFDGMNIEAIFVEDEEGKIHAHIQTSASTDFKLADSFNSYSNSPLFKNLIFHEATFFLDTHGDIGIYGPYMVFSGKPVFNTPFSLLDFLLKDFFGKEVEGRVEISKLGPNFILSGPLNANPTFNPEKKFPTIKDLTYHIEVQSSFNEADFASKIDSWIELDGNLEFASDQKLHKIPLSATIHNPEDLFIISARPQSRVDAFIHELDKLAGGIDIGLPSEAISITNKIELKEVTFAFNPTIPRIEYTAIEIDTKSGEKWSIYSQHEKELVVLENIGLLFRIDGTSVNINLFGEMAIGMSATLHVETHIEKGQGPTVFEFSVSLLEGPLYIGEVFEHFIQHPPDQVPEIEIEEFALEFNTGSANYGGHFELKGDSWDIFKNKFFLSELIFYLNHSTETGSIIKSQGKIEVFDISIFVTGSYITGVGWTFSGQTEDDQNINLTSLATHLLQIFEVKLPLHFPDINLKNLAVEFNTRSKNFTFRGETLVEIEAPFIHDDHTSKKLHAAVELNYLQDPQTHKHSFSGKMEADLIIGGATFKLSYELGKETHDFQASWEGTDGAVLDFREIPKALGINNFGQESPTNLISLPDGLDLSLTKVVFVYQAHQDSFLLSATSKSYGTAFFVASGASHGVGDAGAAATPPNSSSGPRWHYVFGLEYSSQGKMDTLPPSFGNIRKANFIDFKEIGIAVASADFSTFTIPQLPSLSASSSSSSSKKIVPNTTLKLHKGVSAYAVLDFSVGHSENRIKHLEKVTGGGHLIISAGYDIAQKAFYLASVLDGGVKFDAGSGSDLELKNPSLEVDLGSEITFKIFGEIDVTIDHQQVNSKLGIAINESEMEGLVNVNFAPDIQGPKGLKGLYLHEADLELGVVFEPPGVNFGFEGKGYIAERQTQHATGFEYDYFALVLEMVGPVPNPLLLAFYVDKLNFERIITLFAGGEAAKSFDPPAFLKAVEVTQLAFSWADSVVIMPDGTVVNPGLRFNGNLKILDFGMHADLKIDPSGTNGHFEMSPVHFGKVLDITGDGKGVFIETDANGNRVQKKVNEKKEPESASLTKTQVVAPGGPVLQFNSAHSPYLHASLNAVLFQALHFEVEADISDKGFHFLLEIEVSDVAKAILEVTADKNGFKGSSDFGLHLKADLGPILIAGVDFGTIHLDTGFDLHMDLEISAETFAMHITGDFEFEGLRLDLPKLSIHVAPSSFADLPKEILSHMEENLKHIFADIFDHVGHLAEEVGKEIVKIEQEVVHEIEKIGQEAQKVAEAVEEEAEKVVHAAEKAVEDLAKDAAKVEKDAEEVLVAMGKDVGKIKEAAEKELAKIGAEIDHVAKEAEHEIKVIGEKIAHEATVIAQSVKRFAEHAANEIRKIEHAITHEVRAILNTARRAAESILRDAKAIAHKLEQEAKKIWKEVDHLADLAKKKLEEAAHAVAHAAKKVFSAIKKY